MSLATELAAQFARFDDDAWAAFANRGLLRRARKDLESATPELVADGPERVEITVGDRQVSFGPDGVAGGRCSCPSPTTCQHLLAAGLWLANRQEAAANDEGMAEQAPAPALLDEVVSIPLPELLRHVGRPAVRWALATLDDLAADEGVAITQDRLLQVRLPGSGITLRYAGGGLGAWVIDQKVRDEARYVALAVLACQRAAGLDPRLPKTHTSRAPSARAVSVAQSQGAVLATADDVVRDCVRAGLAHASASLGERVDSASTWAQGAELYRLARELRRIGEEIDLQVARSAAADDERYFVDLTRAAELISALRGYIGRGEQPPAALVGQPRARYAPLRTLDLVGLGAVPWRSVTGYTGLTAAFWRLDGLGMATWTDARPAGVRGFDPIRRWTDPGPWSGLRSPAATAGSQVTLVQAAVSADARLSGTESTAARVRELSYGEFRDLVPAYDDFDVARRERAPLPHSPLDLPPAARAWVVLEVGGWEPARFDVVQQRLTWPLRSLRQQWLSAELSYDPLLEPTFARIEGLSKRPPPPGTLLVGRLWFNGAGIAVEPAALVTVAERPVDPLFVAGPTPGGSRFLEALRGARPSASTPVVDDPEARLPMALQELRGWLQQAAERGLSGTDDAAVLAELQRLHARLRALGYVCFPADPGTDAAIAIVRSRALLRALALELQRD